MGSRKSSPEEADPRELFAERIASLGAEKLRETVGELEAQRKAVLRKKYALDPEAFCFEVLDRHFDYSMGSANFHSDLDKIVTSIPDAGGSLRVALCAPRGEGKSTKLGFGLPIWAMCHPEHVGIRYMLVGRAHVGLAARDIESIRNEVESNEKILDLYGDLRGADTWHKGGPLVTSNGVRIEGLGMDQAIRGLRWATPDLGTVRPQMLILDDPDKDAHSPGARHNMRAWMDQAILGLAGPGQPLHVLAIGTAVDSDALVWHLANEAKGWQGRVYRALERMPDELDGLWREWGEIYDEDSTPDHSEARAFYEANQAAMDAGSEVQWAGDPLYGLMEYRHVAPAAFASEKLNDPRDTSRALIPPGSLRHWGESSDHVEHPDVQRVTISLDPSMGKRAVRGRMAGDYQGIIVGGMSGRHLVVLDARLTRLPVTEDPSDPNSRDSLIGLVCDLIEEYGATRCLVESVAFQSVLQPLVRSELVRRSISYCAVEGWDVGTHASKPLRLQQLEAPIKLGEILTHRRHVALNEQIELLRRDGTSGGHDDGPDALQMLWASHQNVSSAGHFKPRHVHRDNRDVGERLDPEGIVTGGRKSRQSAKVVPIWSRDF